MLRTFFERAVAVALPLGVLACSEGHLLSPPDAAVALPDLAALPADLSAPPGPDPCERMHPVVTAGVDGGLAVPEAGYSVFFEDYAWCPEFCPQGYFLCKGVRPPDVPEAAVICAWDCTGRRPAGLTAPASASGGCAVGRYWARMAQLEAASVPAFARLARELTAHGSPARLVRAALRARRDELRHARLATRLARAHGAAPAKITVAAAEPRTLLAMARENAVEGCVRETFGALVATWQARAAGPRPARQALASIARDETRHAELAWAVDRWARTRLPAGARREVTAARREAAAQLAAAVAEPATELVRAVGLPDAPRMHRLLAAAQPLWA